MSRSFKKHPVKKDKGFKKSFYNRIFRRKEKQNLLKGKEPPHSVSEVVDDYDVCDWKFDARDDLPWLTEEEKEELKEIYKRK